MTSPPLRNVGHATRWLRLAALALTATTSVAFGQDLSDGRVLYTSPPFLGEKSCADSSCHGPDPTTNLNGIRSAANFPSAISNAILTVPVMQFLRPRAFNSAQLVNLAAYIADPRPTSALPIATLSHRALVFDAVSPGATGLSQVITLTNTGAVTLQLSAITFSSRDFTRTLGTCTPTARLAVFTSCSMAIAFTPTALGPRSATLTISHNGQPGSSTLTLSGVGVVSSTPATRAMVEYRHLALDYYFLTSRATDIALLDSLTSWARTGKSFNVYTSALNGALGINRYYFDRVAASFSRGSHFYTLVATEIDGLERLNPGNGNTPGLPYNEGIDSYAFAPLVEGVAGSCAAGLTPVYRLFRGQTRFPDNPNHRLTSDVATYNAFVALGWDGEGVKLCVPK